MNSYAATTSHSTIAPRNRKLWAVVALCAAVVHTSIASAENLLLGATVTDTCVACPSDKLGAPGAVTDGDLATARNLGAAAPGAFTLAVAKPVTLSKIVLMPNIAPSGTVTYEVQTSTEPSGAAGTAGTEATWKSHGGQLSGEWTNKAAVEVLLNPEAVGVRQVRVTVHKSPAWVAFYEIEGYPNSNPALIALLAVIALVVIGGIVYRRQRAKKAQ